MGDLGYAVPFAIACVLISAFCSGTEVALFSLRRVDREQLARSNHAADRVILRMLERPRRLIATVLIGNQTFNSLLVIISLSVVIEIYAGSWPGDPTAPGTMWPIAGITLGVSLPLVVLISEVTSKTIAAKLPLAWARMCAIPLAIFAFIVTPIRHIVHYGSEILLRPLGAGARTRPKRDLSEEEFRTLIDTGSAQGQVDARERRMIHRVFEFNDKNVGEVMTPRERMFALSYDLPMQRLVKELAARGFSRVPIYQKSIDNIRGVLNAKDLVRVAAGQPTTRPLGEFLHEPLFVPRTTPVKRLFLTFKQKKVHMAIVVSEYGKVLGLVTMDDLLAQIFGALRDERAELQSSIPGRNRARTPPVGTRISQGEITGPVPKGFDSGPVPRQDASELQGEQVPSGHTHDSGPTRTEGAATALGQASPPGLRPLRPIQPIHPIHPIHPLDEVTPPAIDVTDLREQDKRS